VHRNALAAVALASAGLVASTALLTVAGPLAPPAGPVASTYKTLTEVEPRTPISLVNTPGDADSLFKITQPGSYYLTGNITGVSGKIGIEIATADVTLDLSGFTVRGVPGTLSGISTFILTGDLAIHNGIVADFGSRGVDAPLMRVALRDVAVRGNGISVTSSRTGASVGSGSRVTDCTFVGNGFSGLSTGSNSVVDRCTATGNAQDGFDVGSNCSISHCAASENGRSGFSGANNVAVTSCVANDNGMRGIHMGSLGVITACTAYQNGAEGIRPGSAGVVEGCSVNNNVAAGIYAVSDCLIRNNTCTDNGPANIQLVGSGNRVEGNNCVDGERGIWATVSDNLIIRNSCSSATVANWQLVGGNVVGPIVLAPGGGAVAGNTAPSSLATTDPNANFTY